MSTQKTTFDPSQFAVSGTSDPGDVGVKKVVTKIEVRKPSKQEFFQAHPTLQLKACVVEVADAMSRVIYLVDPAVAKCIPGDYKVRTLTLCQNRQEGLFLWPVPDPASETIATKWSATAREAAALARGTWVRVVSNMSAGEYQAYKAENLAIAPVWPNIDMSRVLELAFGEGRVIDCEQHPIVRQLQGLE